MSTPIIVDLSLERQPDDPESAKWTPIPNTDIEAIYWLEDFGSKHDDQFEVKARRVSRGPQPHVAFRQNNTIIGKWKTEQWVQQPASLNKLNIVPSTEKFDLETKMIISGSILL